MPHYKTQEEVNAEFDEKFPALMPRDSRIELKSFIQTLRTDDLQAVRELIKEHGHQQEDDTIWCNMDDLLKALLPRT